VPEELPREYDFDFGYTSRAVDGVGAGVYLGRRHAYAGSTGCRADIDDFARNSRSLTRTRLLRDASTGARRLWARIMRERFSCSRCAIVCCASCANASSRGPAAGNNIRVAFRRGGGVRVPSLQRFYGRASGCPTEMRRIARAQQIIAKKRSGTCLPWRILAIEIDYND